MTVYYSAVLYSIKNWGVVSSQSTETATAIRESKKTNISEYFFYYNNNACAQPH